MINDNHVVLGEFLKMFRKDIGLSQGQVAKKLNYSIDAISKIERGLMRIPENKILDVVTAYKMPKEDFLFCALADYKKKLMEILDLDPSEVSK